MVYVSQLGLALIAAGVGAAATLFFTPFFMRFFGKIGITGIDKQKPGAPTIPTSGGMPVVFSFFLGTMLFIALDTFYFHFNLNLTFMLAAVLSVFAISLVGFFDDIFVRKELVKNVYGELDTRVGLQQWMKPLLTLVAAIPLMAVTAGTTSMTFPFVGVVQLGWVYPLILIPIAVVCVSNATNMLAGANGLEAGLVAMASLAVFAWSFMHGNLEGAAIAIIGAGALLAFLYYNWIPAKMLPGDSLTYFAGAMLISAVILGNVEKFGLAIFIPWMLEAFLKLRSGFKARSYGDLQKDGGIKAPYPQVYSLTHAAMKLGPRLGIKRWGEKQVVLTLYAFEALCIAFAFIMVKAPSIRTLIGG